MKANSLFTVLVPAAIAGLILSSVNAGAALVTVQAESGARGAEYATNVDGSILYLYPTTSGTTNNPVSAARVTSYSVTFPAAGTYKLYAKLRVGSGAANDDSFFYANGFGAKAPAANGDWILMNNLNSAGYTAATDVVSGNGSAGNQVWKWVNLSEFSNGGGSAPISFTVSAGNLTQTFQIGAREDGLFIDQFVFGTADTAYTVTELEGSPPPAPVATTSTVNWDDVRQQIDGFGASSAWVSTWSVARADLLFSTNNSVIYTDNLGATTTTPGVGLSILRTRIAPGATTVENSIMQMARDRGAIVWSAPWSPAANFKSNTNVNGGSFVGTPANYQAYATQLAGYVRNMKVQYNVDLYALSVQNEPDANVTTYESCNWTAQQVHDFVPYLYSALAATNMGATRIMLPESQNWQDYQNLADTAMADPTVASMVSIVANHNYDGTEGPTPVTRESWGKALWETEVSILSGSDSSIANGVYYARRIHRFLTQAEVNAWHYWWLISANTTGNQGLLDNNGSVTKRLFTHGNYSRFVRPGFYRIGATSTNYTLVSAFKHPASSDFAVVVVNTNSGAVDQTITLSGGIQVSSVTPWVTSSSLSLASQPAVGVTNLSFTYRLPATSVVTFVGRATTGAPNQPPSFQPVPDTVVNAGTNLVVANVATDPDVPGTQVLTYSLLNGPTNAQVNAATGTLTWRPLVSQAGSVNAVSVEAADNGTPILRATNSFDITVNPLTPVSIEPIDVLGGQVTISITGPAGPDYSLWTSTNLLDWVVAQTTNGPAVPVTLTEPNTGEPARFYRAQIGP